MNKKIFTIGVVALVIDQVTKGLVDTFIDVDEVIKIIGNFFSITRVNNTGAAFSLLEGNTFFLVILSFVCLFMLIKLIQGFKNNWRVYLAFGLSIGGIFGNLGDRLFLGYVRDFLRFKIFGYNFPIFNIADVCIVVGVILLMVCMFMGDDKSVSTSKRIRRKH